MKKVLSIDLDYIIGDSLEKFYDEIKIFHNFNAITMWNMVFEFTDIKEDDLIVNHRKLSFCYDLFVKCLETSKSVSFGYEHDQILYSIENFDNIHLINIDHHDDFLGGDFLDLDEDIFNKTGKKRIIEYEQILKTQYIHEGNWISWLHSKNKLSSYIWISNENSGNRDRNELIKSMVPNYVNRTQDNLNIPTYNFDHIFVCLSPQYIPPKYWKYFNMFIDVYEKITKKSSKNCLMIDKKYMVDKVYSIISKSLNIK